MAGYTRQSSYTDGDIINAADSNDEFDQILAAFNNSSGHKHDGTAAEGPVIGLIGDAGSTTPKNKVVVDNANDQIEVSIDVSGTSTEQFVIKDGVIEPTTDNDIDLGSSSKEFKDLYIDGTAYVDAINYDGTAVTATAAELNLMDGGTTAGTTAVAGGDGIVTNDGGTMRQTTVDTFDTYLAATTKTLTNKTIDADNNTLSNIEVDNLKSGVLDTDLSSVAATDTTLASAKAIKSYVDSQVTAQDLDFQGDSGGALSIDLDSESLTIAGGTGIDTSGSGNTLTVDIDSTVATLTGSQTLTNKTLTSPVLNGTISGTSIKDEDNMSSDSATHLATQQSIKAYVDSQVATKDALSELSGDTDDVSEGTTNLYFTNERVDDRVDSLLTAGSNITLTYDDTANTLTIAATDTDTGILNVVEDTTPQLGGDLDVNTNNISFGDSATAGTDDTLMFGAGNDMMLYHDGTHNYIKVSSGNMRVQAGVFNVRSANNNLNQITTLDSAGVTLYHNGAQKFDTVATGVDITGSLDVTDGSTTRTNLGVAIGSDVQAYDAGLASIAGLTTAANKVIYTTASDTYAVADFTAFGRSLVDDADAAAGRTTLGLGTAATSASTDFDAAGQSVVMAIALG